MDMPTTATDLRYGRRGGGWLPPAYVPTEPRAAIICDICGHLVLIEAGTRHAMCTEAELTLFDG
jgi:hypothetical protein